MLRRLSAAAVATALAGLTAAPALAHGHFTESVVPYRSIGGVTLGSTPSQIRARFGAPDAVFHEDHKVSGYQYDALQMQIDFDTENSRDRANLISANGTHLRSIKGIHYGTPIRIVRSRLRSYKSLRCMSDGCSISRGEAGAPGSSGTSFSTENGRVNGFVVSTTFHDG